MGIFDSRFSKIADRILKKSEEIEKYEKLFEKNDASIQRKINALKQRLTQEYKFFSVKPQHANILAGVEKDILSIKYLPKNKTLTENQKETVLRLCRKYNITQF